MARQPKKVSPQEERAPNYYTRAELEGISKTTEVPVEQLWGLPRREVQQIITKAASRAADQREKNANAERLRLDAQKQYERPMAERMPMLGAAVDYGSAALPFLLPFLSRRYSKEQKLVREWDKATREAERMTQQARRGTGDVVDAAAAVEKAGAYRAQYDALQAGKSKPMEMVKDAGIIGGTALGTTELPVILPLLDSYTRNPGTRAYDEAKPKLTLNALMDRLIASGPLTAGLSGLGLKAGTMAARTPPIARTQAVQAQLTPGWSAGPGVMAENYTSAATAQTPLMDARTQLALQRLRDGNMLQAARAGELPALPPAGPARPAMPGTVLDDGARFGQGPAGPAAAQPSQPPVAPVQSPSPAPPVAQPSLPQPAATGQLPVADPVATGAAGALPPPGPWSQSWSPAARAAVEDHVGAGGNIHRYTGLTGNRLLDMIKARLPADAKPPSPTEVKDRLAALRTEVGSTPTKQDLKKLWLRDKNGQLFAVPATGAIGYGLLANGEGDYFPDRGPRRGYPDL